MAVRVVVMSPTASAVPPLRAIESAPDLASDGRGVEVDFEPWFHAAREALAAGRSR